MKIFLAGIFCLFTFQIYGQKGAPGNYYNHFGSELEINPDSTFKYKWRFDLASSWTKGKWKIKNDTIYFTKVPVLDTLKYKDDRWHLTIYSLVLSIDELPESITKEEFASYQLNSGGQNRHLMPGKLFLKKDKLFEIGDNGRLIKKKGKGDWTNKKVVPWYLRKQKLKT